MPSLTAHLLSLDPSSLKATTEHPFLLAAANNTLPLPLLQSWLAQDRLYQTSYITFIGAMLSKIPVPCVQDRKATLEWKTVDLLIDALANIREEMELFERTAREEGWLDGISDVKTQRETRAYMDLFAGATARGRPLVVGLVVLWATEEIYLRSWRYAWERLRVRRQAAEDKGKEEEEKGKEKDVMERVFIPNWSSPAFEAFVRRLGGLVNRFGGCYDPGSWEWRECEEVWAQVLWAEREFWPKIPVDGGKEE